MTATSALAPWEAARRARPPDADALVSAWRGLTRQPALHADAVAAAVPTATALRAAATLTRGTSREGAERDRAAARELLAEARRLARTAASRAELDLADLGAELDTGDLPAAGRLRAVVDDALDQADAALAREDHATAARLLVGALTVALHRNLHCEDLPSPLAEDPDAFLAPFRAALTYRRLLPPSTPAARPAPAGPAAPTPRCDVLAVSRAGLHFLEPVLEHAAAAGLSVQRLDLRAAGGPRVDLVGLVADRLAGRTGTGTPAVPDDVTTVVVDWCDEAAVWASTVLPPGPRLVVRLHSVEALSAGVHLVDWSRVDDLVFVSTPLRDLVLAELPGLTATTRVHVVPNALPVADFGTEKAAGADRTLAMVGWAVTVKDPVFALDVLERLRQRDDRWRLLLVGGDFPDALVERAWAYRERLEQRLAALEAAGTVSRLGHRSDLPQVLAGAGVILSTSRRESFHVGLLQGAASGAVPVVRDWPLLRPWGGAAAVVDPSWVVDDVQQAVDRIERLAGDEATLRAEGRRAAAWVRRQYPWPAAAQAWLPLLGAPDGRPTTDEA